MPPGERAKLHDIVNRAHAAGYRVDQINTDDLAGLEVFLRDHKG